MKYARKKAQDNGNREKILDAAFSAFAESGFNGATTRDICRRVGVNVSTLHYYWGDKEQLWRAVCELYSSRVRAVIMESVNLEQDAAEAIPLFLGRIFDAFADNPELARLNLWVALEAHIIDYGETRRHFDPILEIGKQYFSSQQAAGLFEDIDVEAVMMLINSQLVYTVAQTMAHRHIFGKDLSDTRHRARMKKAFVDSSLAILKL